MAFANYVREKLHVEIFEPRFDDPEAQIFAASVDSFRALSAFALGAQNGTGYYSATFIHISG